MNRTRTALFAALWLGGCISSNPPTPPVRWFDPSPLSWPQPEHAGGAVPVPVVTAAPTVRQEFLIRIAQREIAIDDAHRWSAPPDRLVAAALERAIFGPGGAMPATGTVAVKVMRFELDITSTPRAVCELQLPTSKGLISCTGVVDAAGTLPELLAAAMAGAVEQAVVKVRTALLAG
jgi:ABC-type uncharacterized transport system auxiliary subunit